jgi:hypothetical protein
VVSGFVHQSQRPVSCSLILAHLAKIKLHDTGLCDWCTKPETTEHFLLECGRTEELREELKNLCSSKNIELTMEMILSNPSMQNRVYDFCNSQQIRI